MDVSSSFTPQKIEFMRAGGSYSIVFGKKLQAFSTKILGIDTPKIFAPFNPFFASAIIYPFFILIFAPSFFKAKRCRLTGRVPIAHPPGSEILAFLYLAKIGPNTNTPARMVFTNL